MRCTVLNNATACRLQTFRNHPWIFRDASTGLRLCTERSYSSWQEVTPMVMMAPFGELYDAHKTPTLYCHLVTVFCSFLRGGPHRMQLFDPAPCQTVVLMLHASQLD